jgi:hypothetical protein
MELNMMSPEQAKKKKGRLVFFPYVIPNFEIQMEPIEFFPRVNGTAYPQELLLSPIQLSNWSSEELDETTPRPGWYFQRRPEEENLLDLEELNRVRNKVVEIVSFLNREWSKQKKGAPWQIHYLDIYLLSNQGDVVIHLNKEADLYKLLMKYSGVDRLEEFTTVGQQEESKRRTQQRAALLQENIAAIRYHPTRFEKQINKIVQETGISRNNAFRQLAEKGENWNVTVENVGTSLKTYNENEYQNNSESFNGNLNYNGGKRRKTRKSKRRLFKKVE